MAGDLPLDRAQLKRQREEFVSNLPGTTKWEIFCLIGCLPLSLILVDALKAWLNHRLEGQQLNRSGPRRQHVTLFIMEMAIVVLPQIALSMSIGDPEPCFLALLLLWISLALKLWVKFQRRPQVRATSRPFH